jgi:hypothetical protein
MTYHHSIHEGMDWGAVGLQKNDPCEPAEMTVTKWKCPTKQNTEMNTQNPASKASKLVSDQNMRRQRLDKFKLFQGWATRFFSTYLHFDLFPIPLIALESVSLRPSDHRL